jgi:hypothetical protein
MVSVINGIEYRLKLTAAFVKTILYILFFLLVAESTGQTKSKPTFRTDFDTISVVRDSVLARITYYENDTLMGEVTAFLFPDTITLPRYRWMLLRDLFKVRVPMTRLVKHGNEIDYKKDGRRKIRRFRYQQLEYIIYLDKENQKITRDEYDPTLSGIRDGPAENAETWIYTGEKRRKS